MCYHEGDIYIVAYRLEDGQSLSPDYVSGHPVIIPDGYYLAYMNPCRYKERDYMFVWPKYDLYEYLLFSTALTYPGGEVLFRKDDVISKSRLGV